MVVARKWILKKAFEGTPTLDNFELATEEIPALEDGEILLETEAISVDPYQRPFTRTMVPPFTMIGSQVARVVESKDPAYPVGAKVVSYLGWVDKIKIKTKDIPPTTAGLDKIRLAPEVGDLPSSYLLGALGMPGNTAYFGFLEICKPKEGETVLVNGAAGAVGSLVGQIAKIKGCKVIGYAGSEEKVEWLKTLGFDHVFNYKKV